MTTYVFETRIRNALMALVAVSLLGGCLSDSESEQSLLPAPSPTNSTPQIAGTPTASINEGQSYSFTPTASDADGDSLTFSISGQPSWASFDASTGALSGTPTLGDIGTYTNIVVSVSDGTANASLPTFSISVNAVSLGSAELSWTAPSQNADGTPLADLAGYKLYWGTSSGNYSNSVTINNPSVTTYIVGNLSPGTYEFAATAFNSAGVESQFSTPATKVIQ